MKGIGFLIGAGLALAMSGCRAPEPENRPLGAAPPAFVGRVLRVNQAEHFVILQCERLPSAREALKLYRGKEPAGAIRADGPFRYPFVVADILEGAPRRGDVAKRDRRAAANPATSKDEP
ncbi:MAG: hypothetical protein KJ726_03425 [Verrucomicrobia bacterium]|nr:hypothetical protein [Verrucomicrobiota bacterium]MBU1909076.1 hypothetical protein [Verrucomicrobiota bacterium]